MMQLFLLPAAPSAWSLFMRVDDDMNIATFHLRTIKVWFAYDFLMSTIRTRFHERGA